MWKATSGSAEGLTSSVKFHHVALVYFLSVIFEMTSEKSGT